MNSNRRGFIVYMLVAASAVAFAQEFTPPPTIDTPPVVTTTLERVPVRVVVTQIVERAVSVTNTTATLVRFTVEIDRNQNPAYCIATMSDGTRIVTPAREIGGLTNRVALSLFNGLLADAVGSGRVVYKPRAK
jgi:hypothetical protein